MCTNANPEKETLDSHDLRTCELDDNSLTNQITVKKTTVIMRPTLYLTLPVIATVLDILWACFLLRVHPSNVVAYDIPAVQEIPATAESVELPDQCGIEGGDQVCGVSFSDAGVWSTVVDVEDEDEEDPMLQQMPEFDFKAYVRQDISSFYGEEPGSRTEKMPSFRGQAGKFVNMSPERLSLYWDDGDGDTHFIGYAGPFEAAGTSTYPGHVFLLAPHGKPDEKACVCNVVKGTAVYFYDPFSKHSGEPGRCTTTEFRSLDELSEEDRLSYEQHKLNLEFGAKYREFTGGTEWLTMYPRSPPRHKIWRADYFGQKHTIQTKETHFVEMPPGDVLPKLSMEKLRRNESDPIALQDYRSPAQVMNLTLTTVSCAPRAFQIDDFLSEVEVNHILDLAKKKNLHLSTTGSNNDAKADTKTRTSTNTWLSRYSSPIVDAIYRRAADALRLDEALLRHRLPDEYPELGSNQPLSEDLQLVHYDVSEEYTAHHDFGYTDGRYPNSPSRSINVLLYLNEGMEGGETSFPKWRNAETSNALDVKPVKGKAVIFYMRTPDGNLDDLTQHAALPVVEGEKWLANLWIWDPIKL